MVTWPDVPERPRQREITIFADDIEFTTHEYATSRTLGVDNYLVLLDTSSGNIKITLPPIASHPNRVYTIKNVGKGKVTVVADGSEKIEWEGKLVLGLQGDFVILHTSGSVIKESEWFIIGGRNVKLEELLNKQTTDLVELLKQILKSAEASEGYLKSMDADV